MELALSYWNWNSLFLFTLLHKYYTRFLYGYVERIFEVFLLLCFLRQSIIFYFLYFSFSSKIYFFSCVGGEKMLSSPPIKLNFKGMCFRKFLDEVLRVLRLGFFGQK